MKIDFELMGMTPFLMHKDDVEGSDQLKIWRTDPKNKEISVPGDDRSPAWTWHTYIHNDGKHFALPFDMLLANLRCGGAKKILKKMKTYKESVSAGTAIDGEFVDFFTRINGGWKQVPIEPIVKMQHQPFAEQADRVRDLGFSLFVKRAKPEGARGSKHVRVRPRFENWKVSGTLTVSARELTFSVMEEIFNLAGRIGLGDWRPGSPKSPGPFGQYRVEKLSLVGD